MKATTSVSTTFAATHDRHRVGLLVSLTGDVSVKRPPINVALVLDRSGSMAGEPMARPSPVPVGGGPALRGRAGTDPTVP